MGQHSRVQAAEGYRAAVIELKPGLFLVAEMPEAMTRPEIGFVPMLAPLMVKAAKGAIDAGVRVSQGQKPLQALFPKASRALTAKREPQTALVPVEQPPVVGWAHDVDLGCDRCRGTCR